jgi:hypothetical protein
MLLPSGTIGRSLAVLGLVCTAQLGILTTASAGCYCACINGENQPICDSSDDVAPICLQKICPAEPPAVLPVGPLPSPPPGTQACDQEQVWDHDAERYIWKTVCW